jgi:hypothetical protein
VASLLVIPRFILQRFGPKRTERPRDETQPLILAHELAGADVTQARADLPAGTLSQSPHTTLAGSISVKAGHRLRTVIVAGIILASILAGLFFYRATYSKTTYYIAYIGRDQRPGFDDLHELALRKYINELNAELHDVRLELKRFSIKVDDDHYNSRKVYEEQIAGNKQYVVVIDNTWGSELKSVADQIRDRGIPVIAINADKQDVDYYNNVVFIGYDDDVPEKIANFSKKILRQNEIIFVTEKSYAFQTKRFLEEFKNSAIETTPREVSSAKVDKDEQKRLFEELDGDLKHALANRDALQKAHGDALPKRPAVIINTHAKWGEEIIRHINASFKGIDIVGGPYIVNQPQPAEFGPNNNNKLIILTYPGDSATKKVYDVLNNIKFKNPQLTANSMQSSQLFVKRCLDAVSIIRGVFYDNYPQRSTISREDVIKFFREKLASKYIVRRDDLYSFNENLLLSDERSFEQYFQGEVLSYPEQLGSEGEPISNIDFDMNSLRITNIDVKNRSFHADFVYGLKYDKPEMEGYFHFRNQKPGTKQEPVPAENTGEASQYHLYKMSGDFSMNVDLERYPLDAQELTIEMEITDPRVGSLHISPDSESSERSTETSKEDSADEWDIKGWYVTVDNFLGNPLWGRSSLEHKKPQKFKTWNVRIPIYRRWSGPVVTIILPLVIIGFAAVLLLFVKDSSFANTGHVCVGVFLSIVTYSNAFAQITPRANVLTIADLLFYGTFIAVLLVLLKFILLNSSLITDNLRSRISNRSSLTGSVGIAAYVLMIAVILIHRLT